MMVGWASATLFSVFDRECVVRRTVNDTDKYGPEHLKKSLILFLMTLKLF